MGGSGWVTERGLPWRGGGALLGRGNAGRDMEGAHPQGLTQSDDISSVTLGSPQGGAAQRAGTHKVLVSVSYGSFASALVEESSARKRRAGSPGGMRTASALSRTLGLALGTPPGGLVRWGVTEGSPEPRTRKGPCVVWAPSSMLAFTVSPLSRQGRHRGPRLAEQLGRPCGRPGSHS